MEKRTIDTLALDGGWLCLDFINTVHDRTVREPFEYLSGYADLLDWSVRVGLLTSLERNELASVAGKKRKQADKVLNHFIEARETLYDFFLAIAQNRIPNNGSQVKFNSLLTEVMSQLELQVEDHLEVHQQWKNRSDLEYPLQPIIKSAYDLITSEMLDRVKECGACGWLFLDQSKNKSRKWCSMETCGSNVKAKRYYHRNKKKKG